MKKQLSLLSTIFLGSVLISTVGTNVSLAAPTAEVDSNATLKAVAGTEPVKPVNPTDPKDPSKPGPIQPADNGNEISQTGPLQINYLSNLNFGDDISITSKTVTANVKDESTRFFQISDLRGTGAGWDLNVKLGDFLPESGGTTEDVIKGASITFKNGVARTSNDINAQGTDDNPATVPSELVLSSGSASVSKMMSAEAGNGRGTWIAAFDKPASEVDNSNITFSAPTNNISANTNYTAKLTWQLVDSPAQ
ncbi:WxL domain-containing protein [Vagococcus teuberi]|uniref:WxL domain-containing protein n=1 Tax=Vagococcus teuberi TaxID=519472 RepID=A0A1J0A7Z0_9ENTE|nr:WxL domain-containing protein [Vagococcus teuberi]APB32042.1 hypothetical protein BHY08_09615 [Vagococcus teuberi]